MSNPFRLPRKQRKTPDVILLWDGTLTPPPPLDADACRQEALEYFKRIRSLGAYPPWPMCSLLVQLLASEGMLEEADEQFADILAHGVLPTESCATMMIRLRVQVRYSIDRCHLADVSLAWYYMRGPTSSLPTFWRTGCCQRSRAPPW